MINAVSMMEMRKTTGIFNKLRMGGIEKIQKII